MALGTSTILLYLSGKEIAATETNSITVDGVEVAGGGGDLTHASGSLLWNRDESLSGSLVGLSDNLAAVSGAGSFPAASGAYLLNRENHTGVQSSETVFQALDIWTGIETLTNAYNDRLVTLNSPTGTSIMLPSGLSVGFNISFWNGNTGQWTFSGSPVLYNLEDDILYSHTLDYRAFSSFLFNGIETGWTVFVDGGRMSLDKTLGPPDYNYDITSGFDLGSIVLDSRSGFSVNINPTSSDAKWSKLNEEAIGISISAENEATVTGLDALKFRMPYDFQLTDIRAALSEYATGAPIVMKFYDDNVSILSGSMVLDTGIYTSLNATTGITISGATIADDSEISIDILAVGSGNNPGRGLKLWLKGIRI